MGALGAESDDNNPVALPELAGGGASNGFELAPKSRSRIRSLERSFAGGGGGAGAGAEAEGVALKNCVKLPSPEAEPEIPGVENPFIRDGLAAGVSIGPLAGVSVRGAGVGGGEAGAVALTKMRVNSPGAAGGVETGGLCGSGCAAICVASAGVCEAVEDGAAFNA